MRFCRYFKLSVACLAFGLLCSLSTSAQEEAADEPVTAQPDPLAEAQPEALPVPAPEELTVEPPAAPLAPTAPAPDEPIAEPSAVPPAPPPVRAPVLRQFRGGGVTNFPVGIVAGETDPDAAIFDPGEDAEGLPLPPGTQASVQGERMVGLKYDEWELDEVLKDYSDWTGLALMKAPGLPNPKITLKCPKRLPMNEALLAIESILAMHGVALVPMGDKFLKVVPIATARQEGMTTDTGEIRKDAEDTDHLVSQIVMLKHIDIAEAQSAMQNFLHSYGKIIALERVNSVLITDTAVNIKRILEILQYIDQPVESREELRIFRVVYTKASDVMGKIQAIIADAESRDDRASLLRQQLAAARFPTRTPRVPVPTDPAAAAARSATTTTTESAEERGLIYAKVKMVADDRTGSLIVITRPEQFRFLESIITELDRQVEPDVTIKVFRLQYAKAEDVVAVLNSIITSGTKTGPVVPLLPVVPQASDSRTRDQRTSTPAEGAEIIGRLSQDVKIIADPRINALLAMANKSDMVVIEDVMNNIDIMLSQVLIEVIIVEIGLSDNFQSGIDWLQRSMIAYNENAGGARRAFMGFSGVSREATGAEIRDGSGIRAISDSTAAAGSGLSYYFTFFDFNLDVVLNMLAQNSQARLLSTPIILTTDNTEARIMVGEKRPIVTSTSITSGGTQQSAYQYTDIGIELKVTPHINKKGFVVMDIEQSVDNVGGYETIDGNKVPVITTREFAASLSVDDGRTIVVGGLMSSDKGKTSSRIPWIGNIPLLGYLFRSDSDESVRRELLVMITPYVLDTPDKVYEETLRRRGAIDEAKELMIDSWSGSELLQPEPAKPDGEEVDDVQ